MTKRLTLLASLVVLGALLAAAPAAARGGHGGGGWHGGGHWHGGWGYRGWGYVPVYPYYWSDPAPYICGTRVVRVWRGAWVWRRVAIRCY